MKYLHIFSLFWLGTATWTSCKLGASDPRFYAIAAVLVVPLGIQTFFLFKEFTKQ